jgi:vancomycin permeability regulator SanA
MNWFKFSQFAPISIVSYNNYGELGIVFDGGKKYIYNNVNPYLYEKIRTALRHKNYKAIEYLLRKLSVKNELV